MTELLVRRARIAAARKGARLIGLRRIGNVGASVIIKTANSRYLVVSARANDPLDEEIAKALEGEIDRSVPGGYSVAFSVSGVDFIECPLGIILWTDNLERTLLSVDHAEEVGRLLLEWARRRKENT